jgi:pimeloyl-ACP methyl ester carboxylesterase
MGVTKAEGEYIKSSVESKDGTTIGYRQFGKGSGVILVHGGVKTSQDFMKLGKALSNSFTVYLPDRRGRGLSGPHGDGFSVDKEVEDVQAIVAKTGARNIFGLSTGALVVLRTARVTPSLDHVVLYEPPFSIHGSVPIAWLDRYEQELARGKPSAALVTAMKGMQTMRMFVKMPRFVLVPFLSLVMLAQGEGKPDDVPIRALVPTLRYDVQIVKEMSDTLHEYADLSTRFLLLGGNKSPAFLRMALDHLERTIPHVERVTIPGLGHDGPEDDGRPDLVAQHLKQHFYRAP